MELYMTCTPRVVNESIQSFNDWLKNYSDSDVIHHWNLLDVHQKFLIEGLIESYTLEQIETVMKNHSTENKISTDIRPDWLTDEVCMEAKNRWYEHRIVEDTKRTEAIAIVWAKAKEQNINLSWEQATGFFNNFCLYFKS